jgi:hypothetical protein
MYKTWSLVFLQKHNAYSKAEKHLNLRGTNSVRNLGYLPPSRAEVKNVWCYTSTPSMSSGIGAWISTWTYLYLHLTLHNDRLRDLYRYSAVVEIMKLRRLQ